MAKLQVGEEFIWADDLCDPKTLRRGTVKKVATEGGSAYYQWGKSMKESCNSAFCFPARVEPQLVAVMEERAKLKKAYDNSITLLFELHIKIKRGEL